jgi:hypothetical protein
LLCCLFSLKQPAAVAEIKKAAAGAGLTKAKKWNISQYLSGSKGLAIRTPLGWELSANGDAHVHKILGETPAVAVALASVAALRSHSGTIKSQRVQDFIEEAVKCIENGCYRAAVVLSWAGAVAVLYDNVVAHHLAAFNAEALRRDPKWKTAKNADDLARLKESEFLNILGALSILGKNAKQELENCLTLRNGCGHPNSLKLGEAKVAAQVETLILNVFSS